MEPVVCLHCGRVFRAESAEAMIRLVGAHYAVLPQTPIALGRVRAT